ncbi:MAG: hypothetical protein NXI30_18200 [bacterium]|nr:hypothetical protein [bacterium]
MPEDDPDRPDPRLRISRPCPVDWAAEGRDPGGSFCGHCRKTVHDVEAMSGAEVETLLDSAEEVCVRLARLPDGTILARDHPLARRSAAVAGAALAASALACSDAEIGSDAFVASFEPRPVPHVVPAERVAVSDARVTLGAVVVSSVGEITLDPAAADPPAVPALDLSPTIPAEGWDSTSSVEFGAFGEEDLGASPDPEPEGCEDD